MWFFLSSTAFMGKWHFLRERRDWMYRFGIYMSLIQGIFLEFLLQNLTKIPKLSSPAGPLFKPCAVVFTMYICHIRIRVYIYVYTIGIHTCIYKHTEMLLHLKILAQVWVLKGDFKLRLNAKQHLKNDTSHVYKPLKCFQQFYLVSQDLASVGLYQISAVIASYQKNASNCCMAVNVC